MRLSLIPTILPTALTVAAAWGETQLGQGKGPAMTRIELIAGNETLKATLNDTPAARDFAAMLPLELILRDHNGTEKISDLPRKLDTTGAPKSYAPVAGDITLYAPWGNLAIFHKRFRDSAGLVPLGKFDAPIAGRLKDGPVRIRLAD
ncbi:hypothetical protein LX70_01735 [Defluviimonas denitrificans]|jgi:hypothetical protein|uniref:Cyclophilin-like domain-containing protein n=1 Tax=Albidovulum denitrificans TaxID=404881 RepID=A0A2S8SAY2_9RHOB|nr:cyclophilin-like fold protein [Defluviimonas denitrificans]PQV57923.1 hypothetical protein LX70_01735 [Defluviimonas denitrificans]